MNRKNRIFSLCTLLFFAGMLFLCLLTPEEDYSGSERRKLKQFPTISWSSITSGRFMDDFEDYVLDQFPLRDGFRGVKAWAEMHILQKKSYQDLYEEEGYLVQMVYPENKDSIEDGVKVLTDIYHTYLKDTGSQVYFSMIPDKNYFLAEKAGQISIEYESFMNQWKDALAFMSYIDLVDEVSIRDFYRTDSHWKQECLIPAAKKLLYTMGTDLTGNYEAVALEEPFWGVYSGQWALDSEADQITYLTNDWIEGFEVYDYENDREIPVYDVEKGTGDDPYELYLGGSLSLITITNPNSSSEKELLLFRDSFGSSIAPLLAEGYAKVTLIDIRYLRWERLEQWISFEGQDVLFLYSTALLNNHEIR